jgi:polyphosphate kinase
MVKEKSAAVRRDYDQFFNRELSFLAFARRVMEMVDDPDVPLLERVKFAGIVGMLHDEFSMKRLSGLKQQIRRRKVKRSLDGRTPLQEFDSCRQVLAQQAAFLARAVNDSLRPALREAGVHILDHREVEPEDARKLRENFRRRILPILTPLAVDAEHPFPFISNLGLNLAIYLPDDDGGERFIRLKVPDNRPRWVPLPDDRGFVPLEQVIAANLDLLFPRTPPLRVHVFRVTRGAAGESEKPEHDLTLEEALHEPGSIVQQVSGELKARRFAGAVRLQVDARMPKATARWLAQQLELGEEDVYFTDYFLGLADLRALDVPGRKELRYPPHTPRLHPRLRGMRMDDPAAFFEEMRRGDILVHHPYQSFDASVLQFLRAATEDPQVLAIKLTIYRTSRDSPIVRTLAEAARRGKQVAVLVEITARFDEAPNIQWGQYLEKEGCHVAYGVESLKTHVKLALVVREEEDGEVHRYLHVGTGNYHSGTARIYEDLGLLTCDADLCDEASAVFNELTGSTPHDYEHLLIAPHNMRDRFVEKIRREAEHARAGRPCGIRAKMNQLQDPLIIRELYDASEAGVPITVNVRGLCCLRPGVPELSENIRVYGVVNRFLEHSRIYRFENGGDPEYFIGSADWMARNLNNRMECIAPIRDASLRAEIDLVLDTYEQDNCSVWDCDAEGDYLRRRPGDRERWCAQEVFIARQEGVAPALP